MTDPAHEIRTISAEEETALLDSIDRWIEREVAPRVKEFDHADKWPAEIVEQMKEMGLFGATVSPEYGGLGRSHCDRVAGHAPVPSRSSRRRGPPRRG